MAECSICAEEISSQGGFTKLGCNHLYHLKCIVPWLLRNTTCPCCRTEVSEQENIKNIPLPEPPSLEEVVAQFLAQLPGVELDETESETESES
jgi:hypothetical protein